MRLFLFLLVMGFFSCGKDSVETFDAQITCAMDFRLDAAGDTIYKLYMPSGFTPNGDGLNDVYAIDGHNIQQDDFELRIFNRYGNLLYFSGNPNAGWQGNEQGKSNLLENGTYEAQVKTKDILGDAHTYSYRVHLLR